MRSKQAVLLSVGLLGLVVALAVASRLRSVTEVVPGCSLRFDDFVFTVRNVAETSDDELGRTRVALWK